MSLFEPFISSIAFAIFVLNVFINASTQSLVLRYACPLLENPLAPLPVIIPSALRVSATL